MIKLHGSNFIILKFDESNFTLVNLAFRAAFAAYGGKNL